MNDEYYCQELSLIVGDSTMFCDLSPEQVDELASIHSSPGIAAVTCPDCLKTLRALHARLGRALGLS